MRESRSSGSVEGVMGNHDSYSDFLIPSWLTRDESLLLYDQADALSVSFGTPTWSIVLTCSGVKVFPAVTVPEVSHWFECAVKRRWSTAGESPARELVRSAR